LPPRPSPRYEIPLIDFSGQWLFLADVNGDGRCELFLHEHAAMLASEVFSKESERYPDWTTPEDQAQFCVTACTLEGERLWQIGDPWRDNKPYRSHGGADFGVFLDIDDDNRLEHVFLFKDEIRVVDALNGRTKTRRRLDWDGFSTMGLAYFEGREQPPQIWIKCDDARPADCSYCNPLRVLNRDLETYWPDREVPMAGHMPVAYDIDGDGRDELFIGACLLDHDGSVLWTMDIPAHVDQRYVADINGDGRMEVVMALCGRGGNGIVADALSGRILWQVPRRHCGYASVGKYRSDLPGLQVCFAEDFRAPESEERTAMYDCEGHKLFDAPGVHDVPYTLHWPTSCGEDAVLMGRSLLDGNGGTLLSFPVEADLEGIGRLLGKPADGRLHDWGGSVHFVAKDVDDDGVDEAVFNTRDRVWVFGVDSLPSESQGRTLSRCTNSRPDPEQRWAAKQRRQKP